MVTVMDVQIFLAKWRIWYYCYFFRVKNSSSAHTDNTKKYILVLGEDLTNELDYTTITAEAKYFVNITRSRNKNCLSLHYNATSILLYANGLKLYHLRAKDSEINHSLCA